VSPSGESAVSSTGVGKVKAKASIMEVLMNDGKKANNKTEAKMQVYADELFD